MLAGAPPKAAPGAPPFEKPAPPPVPERSAAPRSTSTQAPETGSTGARVWLVRALIGVGVTVVVAFLVLSTVMLLQRRGAILSYSDPHVPSLKLDGLNMNSSPVETGDSADCVVIVTDHSAFDYAKLAAGSKLIVESR